MRNTLQDKLHALRRALLHLETATPEKGNPISITSARALYDQCCAVERLAADMRSHARRHYNEHRKAQQQPPLTGGPAR